MRQPDQTEWTISSVKRGHLKSVICGQSPSVLTAKQALQEMWQAETHATAEEAFDVFLSTYERKYPKAATCLQKDREALLTFFQFPAEHWPSLRTTNPIESTFGTIRHRTIRTKGCLTRDGMLHMMFKLGQCAEKTWRRVRASSSYRRSSKGFNLLMAWTQTP